MSLIKSFIVSCLAALLLVVSGCSDDKPQAILKVGAISGPEVELLKVAKDVAKRNVDLDFKIIEFSDYSIPNVALAEGSIDVNIFQHQPYLDAAIANKHFDLVSIGETFIYPMGIYSVRHQSLADLPHEARIGIPSDPSNEARALRLLASAKFITIPEGINDIDLTPQRILQNPFAIKFTEMDAAQLPRALKDLDFAVINTNYALVAGLKPYPDALLIEDWQSPYANIVVVRTADKDDPRFQLLMKVLHSKPVREKAEELFSHQAIPAWTNENP
jgi:D-methionine transport system substrate-binding protein